MRETRQWLEAPWDSGKSAGKTQGVGVPVLETHLWIPHFLSECQVSPRVHDMRGSVAGVTLTLSPTAASGPTFTSTSLSKTVLLCVSRSNRRLLSKNASSRCGI